jgi:hypothetical protein
MLALQYIFNDEAVNNYFDEIRYCFLLFGVGLLLLIVGNLNLYLLQILCCSVGVFFMIVGIISLVLLSGWFDRT